jgi:ribonuclease HI
VHCDGAWYDRGSGISVTITSPSGVVIIYAARLEFPIDTRSTNNTTEYEALLLSLGKMKALGRQVFLVKSDLKVIQEHVEK